MNELIKVELLKLVGGERLLRLEHPDSGLGLEKRLDPAASVIAQTARWKEVFSASPTRELLVAQPFSYSRISASSVSGSTGLTRC